MKQITLDEAEKLALETDYACFAVGEEINTADAGAFFLEGYNYAMKQIKELYGNIMTIGAGDFEQNIHIETIQQFVEDKKNVVIITGHHLPPTDILSEMVRGAKEKHPELFDTESLYDKPIEVTPFRMRPEIPEISYQIPERRKGHERPYKFHK